MKKSAMLIALVGFVSLTGALVSCETGDSSSSSSLMSSSQTTTSSSSSESSVSSDTSSVSSSESSSESSSSSSQDMVLKTLQVTAPTKTSYYVGEKLDLTGFRVTVLTYRNGSLVGQEIAEDYTLSINGSEIDPATYVFETSGTVNVIISVEGVERGSSFSVNVLPRPLDISLYDAINGILEAGNYTATTTVTGGEDSFTLTGLVSRDWVYFSSDYVLDDLYSFSCLGGRWLGFAETQNGTTIQYTVSDGGEIENVSQVAIDNGLFSKRSTLGYETDRIYTVSLFGDGNKTYSGETYTIQSEYGISDECLADLEDLTPDSGTASTYTFHQGSEHLNWAVPLSGDMTDSYNPVNHFDEDVYVTVNSDGGLTITTTGTGYNYSTTITKIGETTFSEMDAYLEELGDGDISDVEGNEELEAFNTKFETDLASHDYVLKNSDLTNKVYFNSKYIYSLDEEVKAPSEMGGFPINVLVLSIESDGMVMYVPFSVGSDGAFEAGEIGGAGTALYPDSSYLMNFEYFGLSVDDAGNYYYSMADVDYFVRTYLNPDYAELGATRLFVSYDEASNSYKFQLADQDGVVSGDESLTTWYLSLGNSTVSGLETLYEELISSF